MKIFFIIPKGRTEVTVSDGMSQAHDVSKRIGLDVQWSQEEDLSAKLKEHNLKSLPEIVVIEPSHSSPCVEHLTQLCREGILTLLGPQCLMSCLQANWPVPDTRHPVFTGALRGCVVTSSGVRDPRERQRLRGTVEAMWGGWSDSLHDGVTHLVAASVLSDKYRAALSVGMPVMTTQWLDMVWSVSSSEPGLVSGVDKRFSGLKCPPLLGVRVSVTGLERADRDLVRTSVESGGGEYSGVLDQETSVLVCVTTSGEKWSAARRWGVPCVSPHWVLDSLERGECMDPAEYRVESVKAVEIVDTSSATLPLNKRTRSLISESMVNNTSMSSNTSLNGSCNTTLPLANTSLVSDLDMREVKQAGTFLDGCKIYLAGLNKEDEAHMARVLKFAGAVRLTQLVESVTHVIIGDPGASDSVQRELAACPDLTAAQVSVDWVVSSMRAGRPLMEEEMVTSAVTEESGEEHGVTRSEMQTECADMDTADTHQFENDLLAEYR